MCCTPGENLADGVTAAAVVAFEAFHKTAAGVDASDADLWFPMKTISSPVAGTGTLVAAWQSRHPAQ